ncbi:MAG: pilin [Candidatus Doudnabacteria bacterium]|nr:pilin [bacterium]MDZ4243726.1 pilin [Candidatus Doudnabacteria bacterium]
MKQKCKGIYILTIVGVLFFLWVPGVLADVADVTIDAQPNPFNKIGDRLTIAAGLSNYPACTGNVLIQFALYVDNQIIKSAPWVSKEPIAIFQTTKNSHTAKATFWCGTANLNEAEWSQSSDIVTISQVPGGPPPPGGGPIPPGGGPIPPPGGPTGELTNPAPGQLVNIDTFEKLLIKIINTFLYFAGGIAVIFIVVGGFQYVASRGNEESTEKAKKTVTYAVLGLVIIVMAFAIVSIVNNLLIREPPQNVGRDFINLV